MIYLDEVWRKPRYIKISGKIQHVPFGIDLPNHWIEPIRRWITSSGIQFAAKRVKCLKVWAIHILAGKKDYSEQWISKKVYRGYLIPRLRLFENLVDNLHNLKVIRSILVLLNSYKLVLVGSPSLESIESCPTSKDPSGYIRYLRAYVSLPKVPKEVLETSESVNTSRLYSDDFGRTFPGPYGLLDDNIAFFGEINDDPYIQGKLTAIPDKGKYRTILIGHRMVQLRYKKLADYLRHYLWKLPEIASGDQRKMSDFCIENLQKGKYMLSIDLSEATDRLSLDFQIELLSSMGVPKSFLKWLKLPVLYDPKVFGKVKFGQLNKTRYSNGQPMGLFISFPLFELSHYVILKFATAVTNSPFEICGDDVVIACNDEREGEEVFRRYRNLVERLGGKISMSKTVFSRCLCEGVGALFLKGYPKEIRIPSGKLSPIELFTPGTWLNNGLKSVNPIVMAYHYSILQRRIEGEYTYQQREDANRSLVELDLSDWSLKALRGLIRKDNMPRRYSLLEDSDFDFWMMNPETKESKQLCFISKKRYLSSLLTSKIINLYKDDNRERENKS